MKNKPDKGFIKEIARAKPSPQKVDPFTWSKPVVKPTADAQGTPYRMREMKSVKPNKVTWTADIRGKKK